MSRTLLAGIAAALLAGCAQPVGDFARKRESVFHDTILRNVGNTSAFVRNEYSSFRHTDEERELRNVAWDLLRPPHRDDFRGNLLFELRMARVTPDEWYVDWPDSYYQSLIRTETQSHENRYERILDQARSDAQRMPAFRDAAVRVGKADGARRAALTALVANAEMTAEAERRINENRRIVDWTEEAVDRRILAYRTALGRLMVETPSTRAVQTAAAIDALEWELRGRRGGGLAQAGGAARPGAGQRPRGAEEPPK